MYYYGVYTSYLVFLITLLNFRDEGIYNSI